MTAAGKALIMKNEMAGRTPRNPVITDQSIGQIKSEQCSFSLAAASCLVLAKQRSKDFSFDPVPGQGVGTPCGFQGQRPWAFAGSICWLSARPGTDSPSESPRDNGIYAIIPRGLYTALKSNRTTGVLDDDAGRRPGTRKDERRRE